MNKSKANLFFAPYLKELLRNQNSEYFDDELCRELLNDVIPNSDDFLLSYFRTFPDKLESRIFNTLLDTDLRNVLHDIVMRHAIETLNEERLVIQM